MRRRYRKRQEFNCRIESLGPKVHNTNPCSTRKKKRISLKKSKKKKSAETNCEKNMVNVAAYFETSFKHVTIIHDNPTRDVHERYTSTHAHT